ncbi:MAG: hypothetical protein CME62_07730 [Halobacteriovoraceae bacterium]|nr:hypothetical protein [Halobacteriovoraceae bacterium]|tara:strand:- start:5640 stop:7868 length:2229 start_codon:yes stop_codon:yes gene_type:complete
MRLVLFLLTFIVSDAYAKVQKYQLTITRGEVVIDGKTYKDKVLVNGGIPAPKLEFTIGDTAEIDVINETSEPTLIHWHGLIIKNDQDGVPFVNSPPIEPGQTKKYRFKIVQTGTYWYHSHVMFQEQDGLYGAFIIHDKNKAEEYPENTIILSDFSEESGEEIQKNLKKEGEYYDVLKGTVQSWWEALRTGNAMTKFRDSLQRMEGMDYADIAYDYFLANGKPRESIKVNSKKIHLRIINGSATSIYKLTYGDSYFTIVGADGLPVEPVQVKVLPISVAETYDVLVDIPEGKRTELRATSLDNTGYSSTYLGSGSETINAMDMPWQHPISFTMGDMMGMKKMGFFKELMMNYKNEFSDFPTEMTAKFSDSYELPSKKQKMGKMSHSMKMNHKNKKKGYAYNSRIMNRAPISKNTNEHVSPNEKPLYNELTYGLLKAKEPIQVKKGTRLRTYNFTLNGNMAYYIWSVNGVPLHPNSYIKIRKGERVRFVMKNTTMMNHPMHLHGHFFRVMTAQNEWSVLKHTVNVAPLDQTVIEFEAIEEKDWFFHCHILYHMMAGMTRIVRYEDNPGPETLRKMREESKEFNFPKKIFLRSRNFAQSNYFRTETSLFNSYFNTAFDVVGNGRGDLEGEIHFAKIMTRYLQPYVGVKTEATPAESEWSPTVGTTWVLPLNISIDLKYQPSLEKKFELEFENEIQLTSKLQFNYEYSSQRNYYTELEYRYTKNLSFMMSYNQTYNEYGAGLGYTY